MRSYGGAVILMRQAVSKAEQAVLERLSYLAGTPETVAGMDALPARTPFDGAVLADRKSVV